MNMFYLLTNLWTSVKPQMCVDQLSDYAGFIKDTASPLMAMWIQR